MKTRWMEGRVTSNDGTPIAYERSGDGPAVVLVGGGLTDRSENAPLAHELASRFTVYNYDRRGRGASGDTLPYAVERELEDLAAIIDEAGGTAHVYGASSGGALALLAGASGIAIRSLAVYEVPYVVVAEAARGWREYVATLTTLLADGRRAEALELFMRFAGSSEADVAGAKASPMWPGLLALAHTLAYDAACLGDGLPPRSPLASITQPTLVLTGASLDPAMVGLPADFFGQAADAIAASVPRARRQVLEGQTHVADPKLLAASLFEFFA